MIGFAASIVRGRPSIAEMTYGPLPRSGPVMPPANGSAQPWAGSARASEIVVTVTGTSEGADITLGEATAEYVVTPDSPDYEIDFEIQPGADVAGKVLDGLTVTVDVTGNTLFHGVIPTDGTSTLTVGAFALPQ